MRWLLYPLVALLTLAIIGVATLTVICLLAWPNLPSLDTLTDYRPRVPMRVYTADGHLINEFGEERRTVVRIQNVPNHLRQALLAAEDENFYNHIGIDFISFTRALIHNLRSDSRGQGGSTITMQVARNFFLSREKSYNRKLYEILLALKIENNLSKDQILELYINQIFLGQRAYGFSSAAQIYFAKPLDKLSLAETALLAGLPQAPSKANPITNLELAQQRQRYVLRRMLEAGFISEAQHQQALKERLRIASGGAARDAGLIKTFVPAGYVAEIARQIAIEQFGDQTTYQSGLKIITTITRAEQVAAYEALRKGVMDYDRRRGYRGPEKMLSLPPGAPNETVDSDIAEARDFGDLLAAVVLTASPKEVTVYRNGQTITINNSGLRFAASLLSEKAPQARRVRRGALVRIRKADQDWELTQLPEVEAALLSIDSKTGAVRALVGGFDYNRRKFNNVTQAERQPGSSFKPFIYSASLEKGYAPGTLIADEPLFYPAGSISLEQWAPRNYDDKYSGIITLREALTHSKNIPAIRVLEDITPTFAQRHVQRFGFDASHHPPYLTMALGAGSVTPWEMATAYAILSNGGYRVNPYVIKEIRDGNNKPIARTSPVIAGENAPRAISARNAWIMTSLLQDVVRRGTAARASTLRRNDLAGKTGTTNDFVDAWFCGYNPSVVAVSWVGFPTPRNLGRGETGGTAALPIWIDYMRTALAGTPEITIPRPAGIASAKVNDGRRDDVYYAENSPPALRLPPTVEEDEEEASDWFSSLFGAPSERRSPRRQERPAPVEERLFFP
ncbi:MAG: PBP1A family penicillin-binding protein [Azoarcus sp.]|jgi:penicillin-binding protein 1A|nr:PBP1A family penicillin-binding protein [Azoarcus sp.]